MTQAQWFISRLYQCKPVEAQYRVLPVRLVAIRGGDLGNGRK